MGEGKLERKRGKEKNSTFQGCERREHGEGGDKVKVIGGNQSYWNSLFAQELLSRGSSKKLDSFGLVWRESEGTHLFRKREEEEERMRMGQQR